MIPHSQSGIWQFFAKIDKSNAKCLVENCHKIIKTTCSNTSGLKKHITNVHKIDINTKSQLPSPITLEQFHRFMPVDNSFEVDVSKLVALDLIPPNKLVKSDVLCKWSKACWKKEMPACSKTIWKIIDKTAELMKDKICRYFAESKYATSFCCDEWTSSNGKRFMNINYHGPKETISLGLARISVHANAENLGNILFDHLKSFHIDRPTVITTDGASVMKSMAVKKNIINQLCQLHGINLAITDVLYKQKQYADPDEKLVRFDDEIGAEEFQQEMICIPEMQENLTGTIGKVRNLMKQFMYGKKRDDLQKIVLSENSCEITAEIDCKTRWNSILPMLKKFKLLNKYFQIYALKNDENFGFDETDNKLVDDLINVLSPVESAILEISKEDCNLMMADIAMTTCISSLGDSKLSKNIKTALISRYNERRATFSDILWYLEGMEKLLPTTSNIFYVKPSDQEIDSLARKLDISTMIKVTMDPLEIARNPKAAKVDTSEYAELINFLKTIKPSSISSERAFSVCSRIVIPIRGSMSDTHFSNILFLNENFRNFNK